MARMHSRKHGQHGSKKPIKKRHSWLMYDKDEIKELILKLAREGRTNAQIGLILRDQYGIPDVRALDMKVSKITEHEAKKDVPEDLYSLLVQAVNLHKHLQHNRNDKKAVHGMELVESKIRRLGKYYLKNKKLPSGWKYSIERAKLLVK